MSRETGFTSGMDAQKSDWEKFEDKIMSSKKPDKDSGLNSSDLSTVEDKINFLDNNATGAMVDNGEIPPMPVNEKTDKKEIIDPIKYLEETSTGYLEDNGALPPGSKESQKKDEKIQDTPQIKPFTTPADLANTGFEGNKVTFSDGLDEIKGDLYEHSDTSAQKRLPEAFGNFDSEGNEYVKIDSPDLGVGKVIINKHEKQPDEPKKIEPLQITHQEYDPNKVPAIINEVKGVPAVIEDPEQDEEQKLIPHIPYDPRKVPALIPDEPTPPEPPKSIRLRGSIVDTSDDIKRARHISDARLTATRDEMRGFIELGQKCYRERSLPGLKELSASASGTVKKIWRFGMMRYWTGYRSEMSERQQMMDEKKIFRDTDNPELAQDKHEQAISLRFLDEYDDAIHEGEAREQMGDTEVELSIKEQLKTLIKRYASDEIDAEVFKIERDRIFAQLHDERGDIFTRGLFYADNILELAKQVKEMHLHGEALKALNIELDITLGRARTGARTEAQLNACDSIIETMRNNRLGFVNESTVAAGATAAILTFANIVGTRATRNKLLMLGTFGASAVVGGAIGAAREGHQIESERAQHMREVAEGKKFTPDSRRRETMNAYIHEMRPATEMTAELENYLDGRELTEEEIFSAVQLLSQVNARVELSDSRCIDLIAFSDVTEVEVERQKLDSARGRLRHKLKELAPDLDDSLQTQVALQSDRLINGTDTDAGITARDKSFRQYKHMRERWAAGLGAIMGGTIGASLAKLSEVAGDAVREYAGQASEWVHAKTGISASSALDTLRGWLGMGKSSETETIGLLQEIKIGDSALRLPEGVTIAPDGESSGYAILHEGRVVCGGLEFNSDGSFTPESITILQDHGVDVATEVHTVVNEVKEEVVRSAKEFIEAHKDDTVSVARSHLNTNGTRFSDGNELRFDWGGVNNTGISTDGEIIMTVERMTTDGSSHNGINEDITALIAEGKAKLAISLSMGTQKQVFFADILPDSTVHIDSSLGGPGSAFEIIDGHAVFNGAMAEVVSVEDVPNELGETVMSVFATHKGTGYSADGMFKDIGITPIAQDTAITTLGEPRVQPDTMIPVVPIPTGRVPLETEARTQEEKKGDEENTDPTKGDEKDKRGEGKSEQQKKESGNSEETGDGEKAGEVNKKEQQMNEYNRYGMLDKQTFAWFENGQVKKLEVPASIDIELKQSYSNSQFGPVVLADIFHGTEHLKGFIYVNKGEPWFVPSSNGIKVGGEFVSLKDKFKELL